MMGTRSWVLAGMLALCAAAAADVRVFVTTSASGYGLDLLGPQGDGTGTDSMHEDWPIDPFRPTYSTVDSDGSNHYAYDYYYGYYRAAAYPPIDAPSGTADNPILINAAAGEWAYIWFQYRNEPRNLGIRAVFEAAQVGSELPAQGLQFTYYLQNNMGGFDPRFKRWDNTATPPEYSEWRSNPQTLDNITAYGLPNRSGDEPWNMFHRQGGTNLNPTGVGLLGAITGQPSETVYEYCMTDWDYPNGTVPVQSEHAFFKFVPEPTGFALLLICGLSCGRRRYGAGAPRSHLRFQRVVK